MTTVIDQLIVKLGLDPRDFTKGEKEIAASTLKTEEVVTKSSSRMGREITSLAVKWTSVAFAIAAVKKGVTIIDDIASKTRRLGIDAKNYDTTAAGLRNFENTVEMFGGTAEAARASISGFNKAIFDLAYNGQMSDGLVMLARLGVEFQQAGGEARDFKDIALDTADAIGKAQEQGMTRANAFQFLQQAGFDQGTANMLLSGRASVEAGLDAQGKRRQVSDEDITKATGINQAKIGKDQALEGAGIAGMNFAGGIQEGVNNFIEKLASPGGATAALGDLAKSARGLENRFEEWQMRAQGQTRGLRNNNPGNLRAVGNQTADLKGFRVFGTMEEGVQKASEQLDRYAKRGKNTIKSIISTWAPPNENDTKKYIQDVVDDVGVSADAELSSGDRALVLAAMFKHESGAGAPDSGAVADILQGGPLDAGGASPTPAAPGVTVNKTDVQIDSITVQTRATDAEGIAGDMDGAVKRKIMAGHAESGMQ